ncbi:MAG: hypothetical protein U5Q03_04510 [Bacteroidota bacterium]|nr:hypothetical protein [Bacteroidota bacterium]
MLEKTDNIDNFSNFDKKNIMGHEAIKLELIEWLTKLDDNETIEYLKIVKDSKSNDNDWWDDLSDIQKQGIERGLNDIKNGRTISHDEVKSRYGL